jgi:hypothetical protein
MSNHTKENNMGQQRIVDVKTLTFSTETVTVVDNYGGVFGPDYFDESEVHAWVIADGIKFVLTDGGYVSEDGTEELYMEGSEEVLEDIWYAEINPVKA